LWLWNLQYKDEKTDKEKEEVIEKDGVKFMSAPIGFHFNQSVPTILGADDFPNMISQDKDAHNQQYGFGRTARPLHPKFNGHTALKNAFIQKMKDDGIPSVKPSPPKKKNLPKKSSLSIDSRTDWEVGSMFLVISSRAPSRTTFVSKLQPKGRLNNDTL
jgi:hypothetical protein